MVGQELSISDAKVIDIALKYVYTRPKVLQRHLPDSMVLRRM